MTHIFLVDRTAIFEQAIILIKRSGKEGEMTMEWVNKFVLGMVSLRFLSGGVEMIAAFIMLKLNEVEKALMVNSALALVGPLVLITTTTIGLVGMADKLSASKLLWITVGIACLFIGIIKK